LLTVCSGITVLLGAFLLFAVQPLAGKIVTPIFGGTAGVWCLLLVFFQLVVLFGYTLTYAMAKLSPKLQAATFAMIWLASAALVGSTPDWFGGSIDPTHPELSLGVITASTLAVPCMALATIGGMMQVWHRTRTGSDPYHLYSISNIGSLGALLLFPSLLEPWLHTSTMVVAWRIGFLALCGLCLYISLAMSRSKPAATQPSPAMIPAGFSPLSFAWWCLLSALGCALLLEVTSFITQDVAPAPLLWIPPLAAYLLTFIIAFAGERYYLRRTTIITVLLAAAAFPFVDFMATRLPLALTTGVTTLLLISGCFMCNCELYRSRPPAERLPIFYLAIALGGVIGGIGVMLAAPILLSVFWERLLILVLLIGLAVYLAGRRMASPLQAAWSSKTIWSGETLWSCLLPIAIATGIMSPLGAIWMHDMQAGSIVQESRNFYGDVKVTRQSGTTWLYHGRTIHGMQSLDPTRKREVLPYYTGAVAAIDEAVRSMRNAPVNYGIVGLGAGSLAAYGHPADELTFYELDPKIEPIARRNFTFLKDSPAHIDIVLGDARRSLSAKRQPFDLLIVDAFNSDAIPVHLLTVEALRLYMQHITPDGAIVFHTTNRYLRLDPIIAAEAQSVGLKAVRLQRENIRHVLLTRNNDLIEKLKAPCQRLNVRLTEERRLPAGTTQWTDDFSNLLEAFRPR